MIKFLIMVGLIVLFNVLSRKIGNLDNDLKKDNNLDADNNLDNVWANLDRLAKERKNDAGLNNTKSALGVAKAKKTETVIFSDDVFNHQIIKTPVAHKAVVMKSHVETKADFDPIAKKTDVFCQPLSEAFEQSMDNLENSDEVVNKPYHLSKGKADAELAYESHELHETKTDDYHDEIVANDLTKDDLRKQKKFVFHQNPLINGLIFSEILAKPKAKR